MMSSFLTVVPVYGFSRLVAHSVRAADHLDPDHLAFPNTERVVK